MNTSFQPLFANGLALLGILAHIWLVTASVSGVFSLVALALALMRRAVTAVRILAGVACPIGIIPVALAGWFVFGLGSPRTLFQFGVLGLSLLPILMATVAFLICRKRSQKPKGPCTSAT